MGVDDVHCLGVGPFSNYFRVGDNPLKTRRGSHASVYLDGTDYRKGHSGATNFAEA
jgi:hypothetical protein